MRQDGKIELTSNIMEDIVLDDPEPVLPDHQQPEQSSNEVPVTDEDDRTYEQRTSVAIMGFAGGEGWVDVEYGDKVWNTNPNDDPLATLSLATVAKSHESKG